jgi:hypothetical protein
MSIFTVEGVVEKGVVQLKDGVRRPDHTAVSVIEVGENSENAGL